MKSKSKKLFKIILIFNVVIVVLCSLFILTKKIDSSLAKYRTEVSGNDTSRVATIYVGADLSEEYINLHLSSEPLTYNLVIQNYDGSKQSEVSYNYSFSISTLGNLPILITITPKTNNGFGTLAQAKIDDNLSYTNGIIPCDYDIKHEYIVTINFIDDVLEYEDTFEIDVLKITYHCEQLMPVEVSE